MEMAFEPMSDGLLISSDLLDIIVWSYLFLMFVLAVSILCILWGMLRVQREILLSLKVANTTNAEMLETFNGIRDAQAGEDGDASASKQEETGEDATPADFVYCPECSTRVEVDPSIRNINVVCPDCKKPFHIH